MKLTALFVTLAFAAATLAPLLLGWLKIWRWKRRVRSIREAAVKELDRMRLAQNRHDAEMHLARFRELDELHEEELRK